MNNFKTKITKLAYLVPSLALLTHTSLLANDICESDWLSATTPNNLTVSVDSNSSGGQLFASYLPDYEQFIKDNIKRLNQFLYQSPTEVPAVTNLLIKVRPFSEKANCDGVAYKTGGLDNTEIHINTCFLESLPASDVEGEIKGVLVHELTHAYQHYNYGFDGGTLEAVADAVRYLSGYKSIEKRQQGGSYNGAYDTGAFWIDWLRNKLVVQGDNRDFLYEMNQYAGNGGFNWQTDIYEFFPSSVSQLWNEYQSCLESDGTSCASSYTQPAVGSCSSDVMPSPQDIDLTTGNESFISSSGENAPYERAVHAFDKSDNSKWLTFENTGWISYHFEQPAVINSYHITSANDVPARDPKSWQLQGSNDGVNWQTLEHRSGQQFSSRYEKKQYNFTNEQSFTHYRLKVTENNGDAILQIAEIALIGHYGGDVSEPVELVNLITNTSGMAFVSGENAPNEGRDQAFDNSIDTKWLTFQDTAYIGYQFDQSVLVQKYSVTSANDVSGRDPKSWRLLGSNNGENWQLIDQQTNQLFANRKQTKDYSLANNVTFSEIKLEIDENNGASITQLAELSLFGKVVDNDSTDPVGTDDWVAPSVIFKDIDPNSTGSQLFKSIITDPTSYLAQKCIEVAKRLYHDSKESERFHKLTFELRKTQNDGSEFVAYKYGQDGSGEMTIVVSANHLAKVYQESGNNRQVIFNEIDGILFHEVTHGYNNSPITYDSYGDGGEFWAYTEGLADAVRIGAGFHKDHQPDINHSKKWLGGYTTTGFFLHYVVKHIDPEFLYKFNQSTIDLTNYTWSFDSAFQHTINRSVNDVWNEYANFISSGGQLDY